MRGDDSLSLDVSARPRYSVIGVTTGGYSEWRLASVRLFNIFPTFA
jgi:hypothetical protein